MFRCIAESFWGGFRTFVTDSLTHPHAITRDGLQVIENNVPFWEIGQLNGGN
jgi:hypothetical protein